MVWRPTISRWWVGGEGLGIPSPHPGCLFHLALCSLACRLSSSTSEVVHGCFTGDKATCPVFSLSVVRPKMRDIMAGMDEKDRECCCSSTSPLVYDSHLFGVCLAEVSRSMDFSGRWLPERFPYATLLGSTVFTCSASVYGCFRKNFIFST